MIKSKLTSKAQTTIPRAVREALRLEPGDEVVYRIEDTHVILTRASDAAPEDPFTTFHEWASEEDREAYADL
jgi:antitoxin PrlF